MRTKVKALSLQRLDLAAIQVRPLLPEVLVKIAVDQASQLIQHSAVLVGNGQEGVTQAVGAALGMPLEPIYYSSLPAQRSVFSESIEQQAGFVTVKQAAIIHKIAIQKANRGYAFFPENGGDDLMEFPQPIIKSQNKGIFSRSLPAAG